VTLRAFVRAPAAVAVDASAGWVAPAAGAEEYPGFRLLGACSGFVVAATGEILTCNHALRRPDGALPDLLEIETFEHARILGEIVGAEPTVNLAIVQATVFPNSHDKKLHALSFGDSEAMGTGHWTLAFGDPAGPERFFAVGTFVAQPSRDCYQDLLSAFYLQVGLVAHPEAYGGPLVDLQGEVIGILAPRQVSAGKWAASPRLGIEFGLPSKIVSGLYDSIRTVRSFQSPWLGFAVMSRPEIAAARGVQAYEAMNKPRNGILIENVFQPSPAAELGIQPGDWLVTFGKTRIFTPVDFQRALYLAGIGAKVELELCRDGSTFVREATVQLRPAAATPR
jgi:serine protease Do